MPNRLTLKATRRAEQATESQNRPAQASAQRLPELQTAFLTDLLDKRVTVYLVSGVQLTGTLRQFDPFTLRLERADGIDSLIFKPVISTLIPGVPAVPRERRPTFGERPARTE